MGFPFLSTIPIIGKLFTRTADIVEKAVVDKDLQNEIIGNLEEIGRQINYQLTIKELETQTIPWVDALHKMGRQLLNYFTLITVLVLLLCGVEITPTVALILGGPNAAYQIVKGKGK
jgi:hypothetical protein